jgi:hypothetical protein
MSKCPKLKMPGNTPPLVLIEWEDSAQAHGAWQWLEDIRGAECEPLLFGWISFEGREG